MSEPKLSDRMREERVGAFQAAIEDWADEVAALEVKLEVMERVLSALDGHDAMMLEGVALRLKQSDGEGWAVGEMVERALAQKEFLKS